LKGLGNAYQSVSKVEREVSWKKKNAKALHIIQISCGKHIQDELFDFETAREAWNHLDNIHGRIQKGKLYSLMESKYVFKLYLIGITLIFFFLSEFNF